MPPRAEEHVTATHSNGNYKAPLKSPVANDADAIFKKLNADASAMQHMTEAVEHSHFVPAGHVTATHSQHVPALVNAARKIVANKAKMANSARMQGLHGLDNQPWNYPMSDFQTTQKVPGPSSLQWPRTEESLNSVPPKGEYDVRHPIHNSRCTPNGLSW